MLVIFVLIILFMRFLQIKNVLLIVILMTIVLEGSHFVTMGGVISKSQQQEIIINFESKYIMIILIFNLILIGNEYLIYLILLFDFNNRFF